MGHMGLATGFPFSDKLFKISAMIGHGQPSDVDCAIEKSCGSSDDFLPRSADGTTVRPNMPTAYVGPN